MLSKQKINKVKETKTEETIFMPETDTKQYFFFYFNLIFLFLLLICLYANYFFEAETEAANKL